MLNLLLASATPATFIAYNALPLKQKFTTGYHIWIDLTFAIFCAFAVHSLIGTTDLLPWLGLAITVENYGGMLSGCALIFILYIGPLVQTAFIEDEGPEFNLPEVKAYITDPFCEEIFFRMILMNCLLEAGFGFSGSVFLSLIIYTYTQCRHFFKGLYIENAIKNQKFYEIVSLTIFNLALGWFLGYIYARTASLLACVLIHIFKNIMGFPDLEYFKKNHQLYSKRWIIAVAYIIGIVLFIQIFKLIMMNPELYTTWLTTLAY